ncbi:MAG: ABC transporter [Desulfobacterales bacterium CG07_land_8_20_14_0_80_52_14]|nr:MAG: ABC transporter [Desulfobacterales bacterium CG23_combo_of_CG06-09_8_20_14_all_52_9]PIU49064.1 MAG: ABC transporter [Desulfobacterales bacterium CG07_land_8_20_14_0_80_52_14]
MIREVIRIRDMWFSYNGAPVLKEINLVIKEKEFLALIGPNGGGKTTLLKLMLGLLKPDRGSILIFDRSPHEVAHRIGYVPQSLYTNQGVPVTALEVVLMGRRMPGSAWRRYQSRDKNAAQKAMEQMGIWSLRKRRVGALSGGQRQRLLISRALVAEPDMLFLDEPAANIDAKGQGELYDLLKALNKHMTILLVSHDLMVVSSYSHAVACVNERLHYHDEAEITEEMMEAFQCPVDLIAHGQPHRVLRPHKE